MRKETWTRLRRLLLHLAGHLPEVWPSERTLATKLGLHLTQVHRDIVSLRNLGLILSIPHTSPSGWWEGQEYLLTCLSERLEAAIQRARPVHTTCTQVCTEGSSLEEKNTSFVPSGDSVGAAAAAAEQARTEAGDEMTRREEEQRRHNEDWGAPTIGEGPDRNPVSASVAAHSKADELAALFDTCWRQMARRKREWRTERPSIRTVARAYIRDTMFAQVEPDVAETYIRAFAPAVADGRVTVKEGELPFVTFMRWWGSEEISTTSADDKALAAWAIERYRQRYGSS